MSIVNILLFTLLVVSATALPVTQERREKPKEHPQTKSEEIENLVEYKVYLNEVVSLLESDQEFRRKLENATEEDIRTGKIARELDFVNHHVRNRLDEAKRKEVERLRKLARKKFELTNNIEDINAPEHVNHETENFEIDDLVKLIKKASKDLAEIDKERREKFKEYEMQRKFEEEQRKKAMDEESRRKYEEEIRKMQEKHKKHEKLHSPGSKQQLEEVWEKQDHMSVEDFNPKAFFKTHDLDESGFLDQFEVEALFQKELDKVYQAGNPEDDMSERAEEMERMREALFERYDDNRDNVITMEEFLAQTRKQDFRKDEGWETIDAHPQFTEDEYLRYAQIQEAEIQKAIKEGRLRPDIDLPPGYHRRFDMNNQVPHGANVQYGQPGVQYHPNNIPGQPQYQQPGNQFQANPHANQIPYNQGSQPVHPGANVQYAQPGAQYQYQQNPQAGQQYQGNIPPHVQYNHNIPANQVPYNSANPPYVPAGNQYQPGNQPNQAQVNTQNQNSGQYNPSPQANQPQQNGNVQNQNSNPQPSNQVNTANQQQAQNSGTNPNQPGQNQPNVNAPNSVNTAQNSPKP